MGERERVAASGEPGAPGSRRAPVRPTRRQAVLALQRAAGNAATARALGHSVLQRSIGQDIKDFLFPQPDPDPAPHLKGEEREEARKRNLQSYFGSGVRSARLSFDELNDDIWSSPLTFWGNGIAQQYGMMEEIEDAFSGPALGPETGYTDAGREYALYVRSRRMAAIGARRLRFVPASVRAEIERTSESQVPDFPEYDAGKRLPLGTRAYFDQQRELCEHRLEAMTDLRHDMAQGGQSEDHILARAKAQYEWISLEFSHGPIQPSPHASDAFYSYQSYFKARTDLAKEILQSTDIPPSVRGELKRQAEAPVPSEPPPSSESSEPVDREWADMEAERAKVGLRSPAFDDLFQLDWRISRMRMGMDGARRAVASRRQGAEVSAVDRTFVLSAAREEFGKPAFTPKAGDALVQKYLARYVKMRREFAGLIGLAHLTPPDLIHQIMDAKAEKGGQAAAPALSRDAAPTLARDAASVVERRGYHLMDAHLDLSLDPKVIAQIEPLIRSELTGERLFDHLGAALLPALSGDPIVGTDPSLTYPRLRHPRVPPPVDPADPPGFERPSQEATVGELVGAVRRIPQVHDSLLDFDNATWGSLGPGTQRRLIIGSIGVGLGALGGALSTSGGREMISKLSGVSLPVPGVPWLAFEFRSTENRLVGVGVHVDVGALLPASLGFGAAGPQDPGITLYPDSPGVAAPTSGP